MIQSYVCIFNISLLCFFFTLKWVRSCWFSGQLWWVMSCNFSTMLKQASDNSGYLAHWHGVSQFPPSCVVTCEDTRWMSLKRLATMWPFWVKPVPKSLFSPTQRGGKKGEIWWGRGELGDQPGCCLPQPAPHRNLLPPVPRGVLGEAGLLRREESHQKKWDREQVGPIEVEKFLGLGKGGEDHKDRRARNIPRGSELRPPLGKPVGWQQSELGQQDMRSPTFWLLNVIPMNWFEWSTKGKKVETRSFTEDTYSPRLQTVQEEGNPKRKDLMAGAKLREGNPGKGHFWNPTMGRKAKPLSPIF